MKRKELTKEAIELLMSLISTPSFSSEEEKTAELLMNWFVRYNIPVKRSGNNVWAVNAFFDENKPTLLLNSHHDTVLPNKGYTMDPFEPVIIDNRLFGLGSNDAGGALVSLLATFTWFYDKKDLSYNLVFVGSAEEESSGAGGLNSVLDKIPHVDVAIVGEPTEMHLAIAEKGLVVFDAIVGGTPGHAAHENNDNVIYNSIEVLNWFKNFRFERKSPVLGDVKMTVTQINAGKQHNAIPAELDLVIDVRVNDKYTNEEIESILKEKAPCKSIKARSLRLSSSSIPQHHDLVKAGIELGRRTYGSPTLSDQAVLSCPSLKLGPGDSRRSHMADEYILLSEIEEAIDLYIKILKKII